jgi:hypothetical protein
MPETGDRRQETGGQRTCIWSYWASEAKRIGACANDECEQRKLNRRSRRSQIRILEPLVNPGSEIQSKLNLLFVFLGDLLFRFNSPYLLMSCGSGSEPAFCFCWHSHCFDRRHRAASSGIAGNGKRKTTTASTSRSHCYDRRAPPQQALQSK